jgi:LysM repeat protein
METLQAKQTPASLDPFVADEITQQDRTSPTKAKSQELFARASDLPTGPQEVIFYSRRQETLSLFSKWSGVARTGLADLNGISDSDKELPVNTPLTISLTADDLDRFEDARDRYHEAYQAAFYTKYTVAELSHHTIQRGDSLWKLSRQDKVSVPLWLMSKVNPGTDLSVLSVGDTIKVPLLVKNTGTTIAQPARSNQQRNNLPAAWPTPAPTRQVTNYKASTVKAPMLAKANPAPAPVAVAAPLAPAPVPMQAAPAVPVAVAPPTEVKALAPVATAPVAAQQVTGVQISVQRGESLSHYAAWGGLRTKAIMSANNLIHANRLREGQSLLIPLKEENIETFYGKRQVFLSDSGKALEDVSKHSTPPWKTHQVASGESAWLIAVRQYGITVEQLAGSNPGINLERLQPGMRLRIPSMPN